MILKYRSPARDEAFEAFKLKLALELLMSPAPTTPSSHPSQCSPATSYPSLPSSRNPSPTVAFRPSASYHYRPSNPAIQRSHPMLGSHGNFASQIPSTLLPATSAEQTVVFSHRVAPRSVTSGMLEAKDQKVVDQNPIHLDNCEQQTEEDKKILHDLELLFPSSKYPLSLPL